MSYDLKNLKRIIDEQMPSMDEDALDFVPRPRRRPVAGVIAGAIAACMLLVFGLRLARPMTEFSLSGAPAAQPLAQPTVTHIPSDADPLHDNTFYTAYDSATLRGKEPRFGDVTIRRMYDDSYAFRYVDSDEQALPGRYTQALAYFPATRTGLVGDRKCMALLGENGLMTGYVFDAVQYLGNGLALASMPSTADTEGNDWMNWRLLDTASGAYLTDEVYQEVGLTSLGEGENLLLLCRVYRESAFVENGLTAEDMLYTDLWFDGRSILRCFDYDGSVGDNLIVRRMQSSGKTLVSLAGETLLGGCEFEAILPLNDELYLIHEQLGWRPGVLREDGTWVIRPGTYDCLERDGDSLCASDMDGSNVRYLSFYGEEIPIPLMSGFRLWWREAAEQAGQWLISFGELGRTLLTVGFMFLLMRLGMARREGDLRRTIANEAAPVLTLLMLLGLAHCAKETVMLFPTDTDTAGATARGLALVLTGLGIHLSLLALWPCLRSAKWGLLPAAALMLLPWAWKAICLDVSVGEWQTLSVLVFLGLPLMVFWPRSRWGRRFLNLCAARDGLREYDRWARIVWWALALAAAVNFGVGAWFSGQEINGISWDFVETCGVTERFDEGWLNQVNKGYRAATEDTDGEGEQVLANLDWTGNVAVRWMRENEVDVLTGDMLRTVSISGEVRLKRPCTVCMVRPTGPEHVLLLDVEYGRDTELAAVYTVLALPDDTLDDMYLTMDIYQEGVSWAPSTKYWFVDIGTLGEQRQLAIGGQ